MKTHHAIVIFLAALAFCAGSVLAQSTLYWDATPGAPDGASQGGAGTWDTSTANWDAGSSYRVWTNANNDTAVFGGTAGTVTNATGGVTAGGLQFDTANYIIAGDPLTLTSGATINNGGTATINALVTGSAGLTKTGSGTLNLLNATNNFSGDISVDAATLSLANGNDGVVRTLGGGNFAGDIYIASGATLEFWSNGGTTTPQEFSGDISGSGDLDLGYKCDYVLSGTGSTFTGTTWVFGQYNGRTSKLRTPHMSNVGSKLKIGTGSQAGAFFYYTGTGETSNIDVEIVQNGNSDKGLSNLGSGTLTFTTPWTANATAVRTFTVETTSDLILQGFNLPSIINAFDKKGAGRLYVTGTSQISEIVRLNAGTLEVGSEINDGGVAGSIGICTNTVDKLRWVNSATLKYSGPDNSTDRGFTIDAGETATWDITSANLTVSGGTAATSGKLTKTGAGTLILAGAQQYTGDTTVSEGTLELVGGSQASPITVAPGAYLGFTLGSPTTSTSSFNLTNCIVKITGSVDKASDYALISASSGITGEPTLDTPILAYELQKRNSDTELWLAFNGKFPGMAIIVQ